MISQKKHDRFLYTLLSIYTLLVLVFMLFLNGFFVKPKAYTSTDNLQNFNVTISQNTPNNPNEHGSSVFTFSSNLKGNHRGIFIYNEDVMKFAENNISGRLWGEDIDCPLIYVYTDRSDGLTSEKTSSSGISPNINTMAFVLNGQELNNAGFSSQFLDSYGCVGYYAIKDYGQTIKADDDFQYVTSYEDLKKYLVDGDDSVVKVGDPENPQLPEDNSLPVPQSLTCDLKNNDEGAPRFIAGSWKNPSNLLASYDASKINIEIEYKPKLQFYKKLFDLKMGVGSSSSWLPVTKKNISEISNWVSYMNLSENNPSSTGKSFHKNGKEDIELIASQNDFSNISSHVELLNGSSWRCRYEINGKTSLWVVYGVDSINQFGRPSNSGDSISFENASGDSIAANDVEYDNSNMTDKSYDNLTFIGKIRYDLDNLFASLKSFFTPQDQGNGFYAFFGRVFEQFPIFWALFILGLVVAILLRIFGR